MAIRLPSSAEKSAARKALRLAHEHCLHLFSLRVKRRAEIQAIEAKMKHRLRVMAERDKARWRRTLEVKRNQEIEAIRRQAGVDEFSGPMSSAS